MKRRLNHAVGIALLLLYTYSQLGLLIESIGCHVRPLFYVWVALIVLMNWITTATRRGWLIGFPAAVLLLCIGFYVFPANLGEQLNDAFDRLTGSYLEQVIYPGNVYSYLNLASDHSLLFLFLTFLLSSYMGSALSSRSGRVGLSLLGSIPLFAACLAVTITPPIPAIFGMLLFWFLLAVSGGHYDEDADSFRSVLGLLLPLGLLLASLIWMIDPPTYEYEPRRFDLTESFDRFVQELDQKWTDSVSEGRLSRLVPAPPSSEPDTRPDSESGEAVWQDRLGNLDLSQPFDQEMLDRVFLKVKSGESGLLYLRTVSYGDYLGSAWGQAEEGAVASSLDFAALALAGTNMPPEQLEIELLEASGKRALPYFSTENGGYDSYVPSGRETRYTAAYLPFPDSFAGLSLPESLRETELQYRNYAHSAYTRLPDQTRAALQTLCEQAGLTESADLVRDVAAYVQQTGHYSLDTEAYPSGDYAVYFLTVSREGYCMHFATAAAALYRTLGIPARLTEGFLVEAQAGRTVEVTGRNAHAWVEIYQDGLGWLPVEVTGQSGLDAPALGAAASTPEPTPEPSYAPEQVTMEETPLPVQPVDTAAPQLPVGLLTQEAMEEAEANRRQGMSAFAIPLWLLAAVLLLAIVPLRRLLLLRLRRRSFEQPDVNRAVLALYRSAERAAVFGQAMPEELTALAEKAVFSRHGVSEKERSRGITVYANYLEACERALKPLDRFRFRWLKAMK